MFSESAVTVFIVTTFVLMTLTGLSAIGGEQVWRFR